MTLKNNNDNIQEHEESLENRKNNESEHIVNSEKTEELCINYIKENIEEDIDNIDNEYDDESDYEGDDECDEYYEYDKYDEINKVDEKKSNGLLKFGVVALLSSMIGAGTTVCVMKNSAVNNIGSPIILGDSVTKGSEGLNIYQAVSKKVSPSVVGIMTTSLSTNNIFSIPVENSGIGTGVIVDSRGYILTNAHVVAAQGESSIKVVLSDGKGVDGKVLWQDSSLDLAVVKIDGKGYVAAELGDSDDVSVGDIAIAIGNPLGLEFQATVTQGIISGVDRAVEGNGFSMEGLLQTDASINPGNSGGPLLNEKGQIVGINTAKTANAEGIGFAIPINVAKPIVEQVIKTGTFDKVTLGIKGMSLSAFESLVGADLEAEDGVYVVEVQDKTPAKSSGMKTGDVIESINGEKITDMNGLTKQLYKFKDGDTCEVVINRSGEKVNLKVKFKKTISNSAQKDN